MAADFSPSAAFVISFIAASAAAVKGMPSFGTIVMVIVPSQTPLTLVIGFGVIITGSSSLSYFDVGLVGCELLDED